MKRLQVWPLLLDTMWRNLSWYFFSADQESYFSHYVTDTCQTIIWLLSLVDWPRVVTDIKSPPCSSKAVSSPSPKRKSTYPSPPDNTNSMASDTVFSGLVLAVSPPGLDDLVEVAVWETRFMEPGTATKNLTESRWPWKDSWAFTCQ